MNEFDVTFTCLEEGEIAFDFHRSSGTSRYVKFRSVGDLRRFFSSLGFDDDRLSEVESVCSNLHPGEAYHEAMLLAQPVIDNFENLLSDGAANGRAATLPAPEAHRTGAAQVQ